MTLPFANLLHGSRARIAVAGLVAVALYLYWKRRSGGGDGGSGVLDPTSLIPPAVDGALSAANGFDSTSSPEEDFGYSLDENGNPVITYSGTNLRTILGDLGAVGAIGVIKGTSSAPVTPAPAADVAPATTAPATVAPVVTPTTPGASGQAPASANHTIAELGVAAKKHTPLTGNAKLIALGQMPHGALID